MCLALLFVLLSSCAFGMDKKPEKTSYTLASSLDPDKRTAIKIKNSLEIMKNTPTNEFDKLANRIPEDILVKTSWHLFDLPKDFSKNWDTLNNDVQQIIMSLKITVDPFRNQKYKRCNCPAAIHKQPKESKSRQSITYNALGTAPLYEGKKRLFRVELVPPYIGEENKICSVQKKKDGSVHVGTHIATISSATANNLRQDINYLIIESSVNLAAPKKNIISIEKVGKYENTNINFTENSHYITTTEQTAPFPSYLAFTEQLVQSTNRDTLLKKKVEQSKITKNQIKPYNEIHKPDFLDNVISFFSPKKKLN
jgi:hypothetical protein